MRLPPQITEMDLPLRLDTDPPMQPLGRPRLGAGWIMPEDQWAEFLRNVARKTRVTLRRREMRVSTVPLLIDRQWNPHGPPLLWETIIFGPDDDPNWRYSTMAAAYAGHERLVEALVALGAVTAPDA